MEGCGLETSFEFGLRLLPNLRAGLLFMENKTQATPAESYPQSGAHYSRVSENYWKAAAPLGRRFFGRIRLCE
jgi:hypothetical protein